MALLQSVSYPIKYTLSFSALNLATCDVTWLRNCELKCGTELDNIAKITYLLLAIPASMKGSNDGPPLLSVLHGPASSESSLHLVVWVPHVAVSIPKDFLRDWIVIPHGLLFLMPAELTPNNFLFCSKALKFGILYQTQSLRFLHCNRLKRKFLIFYYIDNASCTVRCCVLL